MTQPLDTELFLLDTMAARLGVTTTTQGAAFGWTFKGFAIAVVLAIVYWAQQANLLSSWSTIGKQAQWVIIGGAILVAYTLYHVLVSQTTITPTMISQNFVFNRKVHLGEITFAKFVYIPYLTWLIAPRLFVRTANHKFAAFYGATPALHQAFAHIHRTVAQTSH